MMLDEEVRDRRAWNRTTVSPADWTVALPAVAVAELDEAFEQIRQDPLPTILLDPPRFQLRHTAAVMAEVGRVLRDGIGLAVVDRIPVERYTEEECSAVGWLLASLLGRPVAQKWNGAMLYDVRDTGKPLEYGVRRSVTNLELQFHTDGAWLPWPAEFVGLLCRSSAREGGVSRFVSLLTLHNEMRRRYSKLLPRLYRPFWWDRQAEHADGDDKVARHPVFRWDGRHLLGRYYDGLIRHGYELRGEPLDAEGQDALAAARAIVDDPRLCVEFIIEPGQLQYLNNRQFAHSRTEFRDWDDPPRKRHMIRFWNRDEGRRTFHA